MNRDNKITIAKAIAIILMVIVHAGVDNTFANFICMFHMPLFFFVSGYCFNDSYLDNIKEFVKRRSSLYLYFVVFVSVFIILHNFFCRINFYTSENIEGFLVVTNYSIKDYILSIAKTIIFMNNQEPLIGGFWFLRSLLVASLLSIGLLKLFRNAKYVAISFFVLSYILALNSESNMLTWVSHFFIVAMFYSLGIVMRRYYALIKKKRSLGIILLIIVALGSVYFPCSTLSYNLDTIIVLTFCGFAGTLFVLFLSEWLDRNLVKILKQYLIYVGEHTLSILAFHFLSFKLVSIVIIMLYGLPIIELSKYYILSCGYWWWVVYAFIGVNLPLVLRFAYDKIYQQI